MARRKKEPEGFHRTQIAAAAEKLFLVNGTAHTSMDEIAKEAGYSKATLYVYYKNKEELVGALTLESMRLLYRHICDALAAEQNTRGKYGALCHALAQYHADSPFYFEAALGEINIDFERPESLPVDRDTFEVGEQINEKIAELLRGGITAGELRPGLDIPKTVFMFWASLSGLLLISAKKQAYIETILGFSRESFLAYSFEALYRSIESSIERGDS